MKSALSTRDLSTSPRIFVRAVSVTGFFISALLVTSLTAALCSSAYAADIEKETAALGEVSAGSVNVRAKNAIDKESIRFDYAYGTVKESELSDERIVNSVNASIPEGAENPVVDVFAEDTPKGRARGKAIAQKVRDAYRRVFGSKKKVDVEVIPVPEGVANPTVKSEFLKGLAKPNPYDIRTGVVIGSYRAVNSFSTWMATPGLDPMTIAGLVIYQTSISTFHALFSPSISKTFNLNLKKPGKAISKTTLFIRRQIYSLALVELTRYFIGSPPNGFAPLDTLVGQAQLITLTLGMSALDSIVFGVREKAFLDSPKHFARIYLASYFLLSPWQAMDSAGTFPVLLDLTIYKVRASTFGLLATYFTLYQSVLRTPDTVKKILDKVFDPVDRVMAKAHRFIGRTCKNLVETVQDVGDDFREFIK